MVSMEIVHVPVLREEVGAFLSVRDGLVVDATLGEGGHSEALLESHPGIRLLGVDADPIMLSRAGERLSRFGDRVRLVQGWFDEVLESFPAEDRPVGILMDLGISSYHLEKSGRGFSFLRREPLDMRLSPYLPIEGLRRGEHLFRDRAGGCLLPVRGGALLEADRTGDREREEEDAHHHERSPG